MTTGSNILHFAHLLEIHWLPWCHAPAEGTVVWALHTGDCDALMAQYKGALSASELQKAATYRRPEDTRRYLTGRCGLRKILVEALHTHLQDISLSVGLNGKPVLTPAARVGWQFNIAHSGDVVLIATAPDAVGVDVECYDSRLDIQSFLQEAMAAAEQLEVEISNVASDAFLQVWVRKEALLKATGIGLIDELSRLDASLGKRALSKPISGGMAHVFSFPVAPGYWGGLAVGSTSDPLFVKVGGCP